MTVSPGRARRPAARTAPSMTSSGAPSGTRTTLTPGASSSRAARTRSGSAPTTTAARSRVRTAATSGRRSAPLVSPPTIHTQPPSGRPDRAARAEWALVALESSTQVTPPPRATVAIRWAPGAKARSPSATAPGRASTASWARARAAAASASATRCGGRRSACPPGARCARSSKEASSRPARRRSAYQARSTSASATRPSWPGVGAPSVKPMVRQPSTTSAPSTMVRVVASARL